MITQYEAEYENRGGAIHIVIRDDSRGPVLCGKASAEFWPMGMAPQEGSLATIRLGYNADCDHGGTRDRPTRWMPRCVNARCNQHYNGPDNWQCELYPPLRTDVSRTTNLETIAGQQIHHNDTDSAT